MTLNGVHGSVVCVISQNSVDFRADYVKVIENNDTFCSICSTKNVVSVDIIYGLCNPDIRRGSPYPGR